MPAVSLQTLKSMLRVDFDADDAVLTFYLEAAEAFIERHTRRRLTQAVRTVRYIWPDTKLRRAVNTVYSALGWPWPDHMTLPFPPFDSISAVTYTDTDGATQTLSPSLYGLDQAGGLTRILFRGDLPAINVDYPAIAVAFTSGYATGAVPKDLQLAICRLAGTYYMNPEAVSMLNLAQVPFGVKAVIDNYAVPSFGTEGPE